MLCIIGVETKLSNKVDPKVLKLTDMAIQEALMVITDEQITPQVYTVAETQRILNLGRSSLYEAIARGGIPTIRIGKRLLIPRKALERMLERANGEEAQQ